MTRTVWVLFLALSFGSNKCLLLGSLPRRKRAVEKRRSTQGTQPVVLLNP